MRPIQKATAAVCIVFSVLAIASVVLRFAARRARRLPLLADDWVILAALVCSQSHQWDSKANSSKFATITACILTIYGVIAAGLGLGPTELLPSKVERAFKV